jgi:hypothetical protein
MADVPSPEARDAWRSLAILHQHVNTKPLLLLQRLPPLGAPPDSGALTSRRIAAVRPPQFPLPAITAVRGATYRRLLGHVRGTQTLADAHQTTDARARPRITSRPHANRSSSRPAFSHSLPRFHSGRGDPCPPPAGTPQPLPAAASLFPAPTEAVPFHIGWLAGASPAGRFPIPDCGRSRKVIDKARDVRARAKLAISRRIGAVGTRRLPFPPRFLPILRGERRLYTARFPPRWRPSPSPSCRAEWTSRGVLSRRRTSAWLRPHAPRIGPCGACILR